MVYWEIIKFSFLRFFAYPVEITASVLRVIIEISFLIYFWSLFAKSSPHSLGVIGFASYFLIAGGVNDIVMAQFGKFAGILGEDIKTGQINNWLLKPVSILPAFYVFAIGKTGLNKIIAVVMICLGLLLQPPTTWVAGVLFLFFFVNALFIAYAYNVIEATVFFHSGDARGIRNAINHIVGIFSGLLIPISLFPQPYQTWLKLSPFPWMVFGPIQGLHMNTFSQETWQTIIVVVFWSVALNALAHFFWSFSIKKYEALGI